MACPSTKNTLLCSSNITTTLHLGTRIWQVFGLARSCRCPAHSGLLGTVLDTYFLLGLLVICEQRVCERWRREVQLHTGDRRRVANMYGPIRGRGGGGKRGERGMRGRGGKGMLRHESMTLDTLNFHTRTAKILAETLHRQQHSNELETQCQKISPCSKPTPDYVRQGCPKHIDII